MRRRARFPDRMSDEISTFVSVLLLTLLLCGRAGAINGAEQEFLEVDLQAQMPADTCSSSSDSHEEGSGGSSMKVAHRYGPCSDVGSNPSSELKLFDDDVLRVASFQQTITPDSEDSIKVRRGLALGTANYIITVGLGNPRRRQTVLFDTGSGINWFQCNPCIFCHMQEEPIFNPNSSTTYKSLPCSSASCSLLAERGSCKDSRCTYNVFYGDGSVTSGFLGQDTLHLASSDVFREFVFGCGDDNSGLFGREAGLFGLSQSPLSLISQTRKKFGGVFSYCLPSLQSSIGDLKLGPVSGDISYTPMVKDPRVPSLYLLNLTGVSVGGRLLPFPTTVFSNAGTLIDSGTVISRLPKTVYEGLRAEFRQGMESKGYKIVEPLSILDTCYDFTGEKKVSMPTVALHFQGGVSVPLGFRGIMYVSKVSKSCLAFAGNVGDDELSIVGNTQQASLRVVYDLERSLVGFGKGSCI